MTQNQYAQFRLDTMGTLSSLIIQTYAYPNSTLFPVPDRGVVEVSNWTDSLASGAIQRGVRLVMKGKQGALLWERKMETPGSIPHYVLDFKADSIGLLLACSPESPYWGYYSWGYNSSFPNGNHVKHLIADLDYSGHIRFIDSSLVKHLSGFTLPRVNRIDSNRIVVTVSSDSAIQFQNQTFQTSGNPESRFDSWLLYLDRRQTQEVPMYRLETRLCGQDSLRIPVLGFPEGPDQFRVELSDSSGSFLHPVVVATDSSRNLLIRFPSGMPEGDSYALRVFSVSQQKYSASYRIKIQFRSHIPAPVITALGSTQFCSGKSVKLVAQSPYPTRWEGGYYTNSDTLEVQYSTQVRAIAQFGSCSATSAPIQTRAIQHHVVLPDLLKRTVCLPNSYPISLNRIDTGAYWYGQYVDSAYQSFVPGMANDTSILHYSNHRYPDCLADTSFTIIQTEKPWLPPLRDSIVCLGSSLNLKRHFLPNTVWAGSGLMDSVFSPTASGSYFFHGSRTVGECTTYSGLSVIVPDTALSVCQQLDTLPEMGLSFPDINCPQNYVKIYMKNRNFQLKEGAQLFLELSDASGSFSQPKIIANSYNSPVFTAWIGYNLGQGDYRIRLRCTQPDTIFSYPNSLFKIRNIPGSPTIYSDGPAAYCEGTGPSTTRFYVSEVLPAIWTNGSTRITADTIVPIPGQTYTAQISHDGCLSYGNTKTFSIIPKKNAILYSSNQICVPSRPVQLLTNFFGGVWSGPYLNVPNGRFSPPNVNDSVVVGYRARYGPSNVCQIDTHFVFTLRKKPEIPAVKDTFACRSAGAFTLPYSQWQSQWSGSGLVNGPAYLPPAGHNFDTLKVVATHEFCSATGSLRIQVRDSLDPSCPTVGIKPLTGTDDEISVYPNPSQGRFTVVLPERNVRERFKIRDGFGREVFESEPGTQEVDLRPLAAGRYWICLPGFRAKAVEIR